MTRRKYTQKRRAERQEDTRRQIIEAAVALHETLGPAHTSIKAIAERAGVQRLTVYRHFPDNLSLFEACTSHWLEGNPPPDYEVWRDIADPAVRTSTVLLALYRYYRGTSRMWRLSYRDRPSVKALDRPMAGFEIYLDGACRELVKAWQPARQAKKYLSVTLRHGLRFSTWESLQAEGLSDRQCADLVTAWCRQAAA